MARVDNNNEAVSMAATDDTALTPALLKVDPTTGALLCDAILGATIGGVVNTKTTVDANNEGVAMAVTDDANTSVRPLLTTTEGYLLISF